MSLNTKQQNAISSANTVANILLRLKQIQDDVKSFLVSDATNNADVTWQSMPTATYNADGTIGAADSTPVLTNPITVPAGSPLNVARNDLLTGSGILPLFDHFMDGLEVPAQALTPRKYADLLNK